MNNNVLGRGLASLIPQKNRPTGDMRETENSIHRELAKTSPSALQDDFLEVAVSKIAANPQQPRHNFDEKELEELARSIKEHGIIQPLIVAKIAPEQYELIAGERRLKASKLAGLEMVPVIGREEAVER